MPSQRMPFQYAANLYLDLVERARERPSDVTSLPRYLCAILLFLRASHEAHADITNVKKHDLEPAEMASFVHQAKNAIIHDAECMAMVAGGSLDKSEIPNGFKGLAFRLTDVSIDFRPEDPRGHNSPGIERAYEYLERNGRSALRAVHQAILDTALMIGEESTLVETVRGAQLILRK